MAMYSWPLLAGCISEHLGVQSDIVVRKHHCNAYQQALHQ